MHRGVQAVISFISENPRFTDVSLAPAASPGELTEVEDMLRSPLPSDLRVLLSRGNGGSLPSGQLLHAGGTGPGDLLGGLAELSRVLSRPLDDSELPLPYFRTKEGSLLAFDRGAGPVADTWPILDCSAEGELRLVHRTFDGWCRLCLSEWTAADFTQDFSLEKYLSAGMRHAEIEPDVSTAHATVAHALRRSGRPEDALQSYLRAGRCVPALLWCDWEALKLAVLLSDTVRALEAATRLCSRAPAAGWRGRGTTPAQVTEVLGWLVAEVDPPDPLLRLLDLLAAQATDEEQRVRIGAVRHAVLTGESLPPTHPLRVTAVPPPPDLGNAWTALESGYRLGRVRDEDLLLDPAYRPLRRHRPFADLLHIRREF
jgi:hypothetical protein